METPARGHRSCAPARLSPAPPTMPDAPTYVRYDDAVETRLPDEDALVRDILATFARLRQYTFDKHRHGLRGAHAKSQGVLRGELTVLDDLPEPLAQGLFAAPRRYPAIVRLSTAPGDILPDGVSAFRGLAVKLLGVEGEKLLPALADATTQDLLFINHPAFPNADLKGFLRSLTQMEKLAHVPEEGQELLTTSLRAVAKLAEQVGGHPAGVIGQAKQETHPLGETYFTAVPLRYGDHVAKLAFVPVADAQQPLRGQTLDVSEPSAIGDAVVAFFREHGAEFELRAQLCTKLETMPIEDASVIWPEDESPYRPVARLVLPAQDALGPARRVYADDVLSFSPWHGLAAHRPLGNIMRARRPVYETSADDRHARNARTRVEPHSIDELPD